MQGSGLGEYIDSFKYVIRIPRKPKWQKKNDFGTRTSHWCGTTGSYYNTYGKFITPPECGYYFFRHKPGLGLGKVKVDGVDVTKDIKEMTDLTMPQQKKIGLGIKRCDLSNGGGTLFIAMYELKLPVVAFGFDNLSQGKNEDFVGSYYYEKGRKNKMNHWLDKEKKLLLEFSEEIGVELEFYAQNQDQN